MPVDAISLEVFKNMFISVSEEMGVALQRTSYSTNMKERQDFSCALFNPGAEMVARTWVVPTYLISPSSLRRTHDL
jgi:N-methylhydantoinase B/oxoprolinase/acetone carboxylase alpha subunit